MASRRHVAPKGQPSNHGDGIPGRKVPQGLGRNNQWIGFCAVTAAVAIFLFVPFVVFDPPVMAPTGNSDMLNLAGEQQQPSADKLLIYTGRKSTSTSINSHTFPHLGPDSSVYNISVPTLEPLRSFDREKYTIRINTWRRPQILIEIINYYKTCPGVVEIQVVWCDKETEPPSEIYQNSSNFVKVDRREINSLNERFNLSGIGAPTLGIIHVDDDDLFPCITLDHIFFKWTYNPERLVALQPRMHDRKSNAYYGWSARDNLASVPAAQYTIVLPTIAGVVHRDYHDWYTQFFPREMFSTIARDFNCEDLALHFFIVALTRGKPALLGDFWALKSTTQITSRREYSSLSAKGKSHYASRTNCTARILHDLGLATVPYQELLTTLAQERAVLTRTVEPPSRDELFPLNFEIGAVGRAMPLNSIVPRHAKIMSIIKQWKANPKMFEEDTRVVNRRSLLFQKVY